MGASGNHILIFPVRGHVSCMSDVGQQVSGGKVSWWELREAFARDCFALGSDVFLGRH